MGCAMRDEDSFNYRAIRTKRSEALLTAEYIQKEHLPQPLTKATRDQECVATKDPKSRQGARQMRVVS
jgi:hypothetical protein